MVNASGLRDAKIGIQVWSTKTPGEVYSKEADRALTLASNTKLLTCAAALDLLGPDFRFETVVSLDGSGNLVVTGNGDPNISGRFFDDDPTAVFKKWAAALKKKGVAKTSNILLVNDGFDDETTCPGWKEYDCWWWWDAPFGKFSLNDNCVDVRIEPGTEGEPPRIAIAPDTKHVTIVNKMTTVKKSPKPWGFRRKPGTNEITFTGEVAEGAKIPVNWVAIDDPFAFYGRVLAETLRAAGIEVSGEIRVLSEPPPNLAEVDRHQTDLATTLKVCLSASQNFYAEMILRTLAWKAKGRGARENGLAVVKEFLKGIGVENFVQSDGSGLTRENRMAPGDLVKLLGHMRSHRHAKAWIAALAVNGEPGTLKRRMTAKDLRDKVRAKTGHIEGVANLSGYVEAAGDTYVFSILVNGWKGGDPNRFQDRVCEFLARYKGE